MLIFSTVLFSNDLLKLSTYASSLFIFCFVIISAFGDTFDKCNLILYIFK